MTTTRLAIVASVLFGIAVGIGAFTFVYAKGASYMTNDPEACANCHIMEEHFSAWTKSSHRAVAVCNDCHTPKGLIPKYMTKASNGFWHSFAFTTGRFPDPLRIKQGNHEITEKACRKCHERITEAIDVAGHVDPDDYESRDGRATGEHIECTRCHRYVGHWVR
jgi:cytochrome c nitrite reductase small subunit